jgi:hypothetical protein
MGNLTTKSLGQTGDEYAIVEAIGASMRGETISLETTIIGTPQIQTGTGNLVVTNVTAENSAVISLHLAAGVPVVSKLYGAASITITKDNASTINVYVDAGVIKIQNNLATTAEINVKSYI